MMELLATPLMCMAMNVYHEARNESTMGQLAVAQVVMNRVEDDRFPDEVCAVITQGIHWESKPAKNRCQFSWYCDGISDEPRNEKAFVRSQEIASMVLNGWTHSFADGATHYHADYVMPSWAHTFTKVATIDNHIFYRWD